MKKLLLTIFILALVLCFALPAFAIKILPYNVPLQDLMRWDKYGVRLRLSNPEGETVTVSWPTTVDLWNYDGETWTYDLPSGDTFAFGKGVSITGDVDIAGRLTVTDTLYAYTDSTLFDLDVSFGDIGNYHTAAFDVIVTSTSSVGGNWDVNGRLYGQRIVVNLDHQVTNTFGLKAEVITSGTTRINDVVGVMGALEIDGVHTVGQTESSMAALRGDINNTSDGSWTGQVYTLFLNYGSGKNYGGTTAWIHAYNHADSYLDYGIHLCQNSLAQALAVGIWLDIAGSTIVDTGIFLDNAGTLTVGIDIGDCVTGIDFTGTASTAGIVLGANVITEAGNILADDAAGFALVNEAATGSNPTLCPDRNELDTGIGWQADVIHIVLGGIDEYNFAGTAFSTSTSDGAALGTSSLMWSDLFLADLGVIDFNSDITLTHAANLLTFAGGNFRLGTTDRIEFRDATEYIHSLNDGYIDLIAATGFRVNTDVFIGENLGGHGFTLYAESSGAYLYWEGATSDVLVLVNAQLDSTQTDKTSPVDAILGLCIAGADWGSGNMVGVRGRVNISATGNIYSATGVWAGIAITSVYGGYGLITGLNVEVSSTVAQSPNAIMYIQSLPGDGADFSDVPYLVFSETISGGGAGSHILFEVGHAQARTIPDIGEDELFYNDTLQIAVNEGAGSRTPFFIPLSTDSGTFTTEYPIVTTYATTAIDIGACTTGIDITDAVTGINLNGTSGGAQIAISGTNVIGISFAGSYSTHGIVFAGTYTEHIIDFSDVTALTPGQKVICAGSYGTPMDIGVNGTMFGLYGVEDGDAGTASIAFLYGLTTGNSAFIGADVLVECSADSTGPVNLKAGQFTVALLSGGYLADTAGLQTGMFAISASVQAEVDSVASSGCRVAPLWLSNQMSCTVSGEEYAIYAITGAQNPDAFIGFYTSGSGYDQFIYAGTSFDAGAGTCFITQTDGLGTQSARIKVWYDGTQYYLALYE